MSSAREAVAERGRFTVALAGGSTPRALYELLAGEDGASVPWRELHVFFGDERCVPLAHPDSNFAMARSALLAHVPIPEDRMHAVPVDQLQPEEAAAAYERTLRSVLDARTTSPVESQRSSPAPSFDLVLLGVGADGHTASLFPGSPALDERDRWVVATEAPAHVAPRCRITLTLPVINRARRVFFLCAGAEKRGVVRSILAGVGEVEQSYPAARVRALERLVWFVDRAAMLPSAHVQ